MGAGEKEKITIEHVRRRAQSDANFYGYQLNYDPDFLNDLLEGLKKNEERFGYPVCPCRVGTGVFELDRDIVCPCDYRDPDVAEYGACYCALYTRKEIYEKKLPINAVPERRPADKQDRAMAAIVGAEKKTTMTTEKATGESSDTPVSAEKGAAEKAEGTTAEIGTKQKPAPTSEKRKMWYCKQCGYVVYREDAPYICPICKARREMFAELDIGNG